MVAMTTHAIPYIFEHTFQQDKFTKGTCDIHGTIEHEGLPMGIEWMD